RLRGFVMKALWWPYLILRKVSKLSSLGGAAVCVENAYRQLNLSLMRGEKLKKLRQANATIERGEVALFERYPLFHPFGDDMAETVHSSDDLKQWPDILVLLDVDEGTVAARRDEDDQDVLRSKVAAFREFREAGNIASRRTLVLRGDAPLSENVSR